MKTTQTALVLALLTSISGLASAQDAPPPLPIDGADQAKESSLKPGVLPKDTSPAAKALWEQLTKATLVDGTPRQPVKSFRLQFDVRLQPDERTTNQLHVTYSFLAGVNYVRFALESGREALRGPDGDFSVTGEGEKVRLVGREWNSDRRQIDDAARISKNFVALTDPGRLRIARLSSTAKAPKGLPKKLAKRAAGLTWIEVVSPDFHLHGSARVNNKKNRLFRALLGLNSKTHRIELAELREVGSTGTAPILIGFEKYKPMDGFQIPQNLLFYELAPGSMPPVFRKTPTSDLYLLNDRGTLRANLEPADFRP